MSAAWLLDTHALLWWMAGDAQLAAPIATGIRDPAQEIIISAAVVWEIRTAPTTRAPTAVNGAPATAARSHAEAA